MPAPHVRGAAAAVAVASSPPDATPGHRPVCRRPGSRCGGWGQAAQAPGHADQSRHAPAPDTSGPAASASRLTGGGRGRLGPAQGAHLRVNSHRPPSSLRRRCIARPLDADADCVAASPPCHQGSRQRPLDRVRTCSVTRCSRRSTSGGPLASASQWAANGGALAGRAHARLRSLPGVTRVGVSLTRRRTSFPRTHAEAHARQESRAQHVAAYEAVRRRSLAGEPLARIHRTLRLAPSTVRKYAAAEAFPERSARVPVRASSTYIWSTSRSVMRRAARTRARSGGSFAPKGFAARHGRSTAGSRRAAKLRRARGRVRIPTATGGPRAGVPPHSPPRSNWPGCA